jgi:SAM-dependent methyltransferase
MNPSEYEALFEVEGTHWWFVALRREIRAAQEAAGLAARAAWLDAGCGTGGLLAANAAPLGLRGTGLDASLLGLHLASRRGLRLAAGDASRMPFRDGSFDCATSIDVLCHRGVEERSALAELFRCLRPGGLLLLQVPAFESLRGPHDDAVWTDRRYGRAEIRRLLEGAGFVVRQLRYRNALLFPAAALWRLLGRGRRRRATVRSDVAPLPSLLNAALAAVASLEARLARAGVRFPAGLSLFAAAEKPAGRPR